MSLIFSYFDVFQIQYYYCIIVFLISLGKSLQVPLKKNHHEEIWDLQEYLKKVPIDMLGFMEFCCG